MARLRACSGQTLVEYLGVMAVLVVLVGGVVTTAPAVGRTVARRATCLVDSITGGACTGGAHGSGRGARGPALAGNGIPVGIPFPGAISITGDAKTRDGVYAKATYTRDRSECYLDADGKAVVDLGAEADLQVGREAQQKLKKSGVELSASAFLGHKVRYQVSTDPATADKITSHRIPSPNPADPRSIPVGTSLTLDRTTYTGSGLDAKYHALQASLGYTDGHDVSAGLQRTSPTTVRIYAGDSRVVANSLAASIGTEDVNVGASLIDSHGTGRLRTLDLTLTNPTDWATYQRFVNTGVVPAGAVRTDVMTDSSDASVTAKLGPLEGSFPLSHDDSTVTWTQNRDGSITSTATSNNGNGITMAETGTWDPGGRNLRNDTYALQFSNVDGGYVASYLNQAGRPDTGSGNRDVTLTFTRAQLHALQQRAYTVIGQMQANTYAGGPFDHRVVPPGEIQAWLKQHPDGDGLEFANGSEYGSFLRVLATADSSNPGAIFYALQQLSSTPEGIMKNLQLLEFDGGSLGADTTVATRKPGC